MKQKSNEYADASREDFRPILAAESVRSRSGMTKSEARNGFKASFPDITKAATLGAARADEFLENRLFEAFEQGYGRGIEAERERIANGIFKAITNL